MIKIENVEVLGWEPAIRGMRNPMNSWDKSDSCFCLEDACRWDCSNLLTTIDLLGFCIGPNDRKLMLDLAKSGSVHAKYRRMIKVYVDITAPLYWWKEFDTYKVGTVANSCSTMHKIHEKEFTMDDFSHEHLIISETLKPGIHNYDYKNFLDVIIGILNAARSDFIRTKDKTFWWQMIQLLPSSYNQRRTIELNYEVLSTIYIHRKEHKLDEWRDFCRWVETLPYSEIITLKEN